MMYMTRRYVLTRGVVYVQGSFFNPCVWLLGILLLCRFRWFLATSNYTIFIGQLWVKAEDGKPFGHSSEDANVLLLVGPVCCGFFSHYHSRVQTCSANVNVTIDIHASQRIHVCRLELQCVCRSFFFFSLYATFEQS